LLLIYKNLNDAIRLAVELETFNRAERRVTEGRSYLRTTTADSTADKVSDKAKDQADMMKLITDMMTLQYYPVYYSDLLSLRSYVVLLFRDHVQHSHFSYQFVNFPSEDSLCTRFVYYLDHANQMEVVSRYRSNCVYSIKRYVSKDT
jgi:hypothetical protein